MKSSRHIARSRGAADRTGCREDRRRLGTCSPGADAATQIGAGGADVSAERRPVPQMDRPHPMPAGMAAHPMMDSQP